MSWETTDVLSPDTTDVLSADTTDVLSADTTDVLSADTANCCPVGFPWTVSDQSQMNESPLDRPEDFPHRFWGILIAFWALLIAL